MSNSADARGHLAGDEIDAYWRGQLTADAEEQLEQHFLECASCQRRVREIEALIDMVRADAPPAAARSRPAWWGLAAAVLMLCTIGGWLAMRTGSLDEVRAADPQISVRPPAGEAGITLAVRLSPPTRGSAAQVVALGPDVSRVRFQLDVREGGAPETRFELVLSTANGVVLQRQNLVSDAAGMVEIAVERSLLSPGALLFDVRSSAVSVSLPFVVHHDAR
jgi:hypothetical protein